MIKMQGKNSLVLKAIWGKKGGGVIDQRWVGRKKRNRRRRCLGQKGGGILAITLRRRNNTERLYRGGGERRGADAIGTSRARAPSRGRS